MSSKTAMSGENPMSYSQNTNWIKPDWPVPAHIKSVTTTRQGGISHAPYDSLNLGLHVEDEQEHVIANRRTLVEALQLPSEPLWLEQIHSTIVADADSDKPELTADASVSHQPGKVCVVMTADCLPVLFTNQQGTVVAAAHAGWRGLNAGVLEKTIHAMRTPAKDLLAWLGPAISQQHFEVGEEVCEAFVRQHPQAHKAFKAGKQAHKWYADIYQLARIRLMAMGVPENAIYGGGYCTYEQDDLFYSYRRSPKTGRMASLIWM